MNCRFTDLRCKEVINVHDGTKIGFVDDIEVDTCNAKVLALVVFGRSRFFGLFGREDDIIIAWDEIEVIGEDTILVCFKRSPIRPPKKKFFANLFR